MRRSLFFIFVLSILILFACSNGSEKSKKVVINYLESIIGDTLEKTVLSNGEIEYDTSMYVSNKYIDYKKILGFQVIGYEIVNVSENLVSAKITFRSKAKTDIYRTHSFKIGNGIIVAIDGDDGTLGKSEYEKEKQEEKERIEKKKKIERERLERERKEEERRKEMMNLRKQRAKLWNKLFGRSFKTGSIWKVTIRSEEYVIQLIELFDLDKAKYNKVVYYRELGWKIYPQKPEELLEFNNVIFLANDLEEYKTTR